MAQTLRKTHVELDKPCFSGDLTAVNLSKFNASCADAMAVSFRSAGGVSGGMGGAAGTLGSSGESFLDDLVPIVAVVAASIVIVVSLIILAVVLRKPIQGW